MLDYIWNTAMSFEPYVSFALLMVVVAVLTTLVVGYVAIMRGRFVLSDIHYIFTPVVIGTASLLLGLIISMTSPSNTAKNVAVDRSSIVQQLPRFESTDVTVQDTTRQPEHSTADRAKRFEDMVKY